MLVRPLSTVDDTRDYARVSHGRQWYNCNLIGHFFNGEKYTRAWTHRKRLKFYNNSSMSKAC